MCVSIRPILFDDMKEMERNILTKEDVRRLLPKKPRVSSDTLVYSEFLTQCVSRIKNRSKEGHEYCYYTIPIFNPGLPFYDPVDILQKIAVELQRGDFQLELFPAERKLFIGWSKDIPDTLSTQVDDAIFTKRQAQRLLPRRGEPTSGVKIYKSIRDECWKRIQNRAKAGHEFAWFEVQPFHWGLPLYDPREIFETLCQELTRGGFHIQADRERPRLYIDWSQRSRLPNSPPPSFPQPRPTTWNHGFT